MLRPDRAIQGVYLHRAPVDVRKQIDGLVILAKECDSTGPQFWRIVRFHQLQAQQAEAADVGAQRLHHWYKRLEKDKFHWPRRWPKLTTFLVRCRSTLRSRWELCAHAKILVQRHRVLYSCTQRQLEDAHQLGAIPRAGECGFAQSLAATLCGLYQRCRRKIGEWIGKCRDSPVGVIEADASPTRESTGISAGSQALAAATASLCHLVDTRLFRRIATKKTAGLTARVDRSHNGFPAASY